MKFVGFAIVLVAVLVATVDAGFDGCEPHGQGYWADPDDCTLFHICYKMPGAPQWTHIPMHCGVGMAFNAHYGFCTEAAVKTYC